MAYTVNKTDGTVLATIVDGTVDTTTSDISLVGRKSSNYGEILNENLIHMLENFASTTAPTNPVDGQLWYDKLEGRLKVYTGTEFKPTGGPLVQEDQPQGLVKGDLWVDSLNNQLYFYDGIDLGLAGPIYTSAQGKHGWIVESILDVNNNSRPVSKLFVQDLLVGILSKTAFTPKVAITGFATINIGLNFSTSVSGLKLHGTATNADNIAGVDPGNFLRGDIASTSTSQLSIQSDSGVVIGGEQDLNIEVEGDVTVLKNNLQNKDLKIMVNSQGNGGLIPALYIDSSTMYTKIFDGKTTSTTEIGGSLIVQQNLTVNGSTTFVDSQDLRVSDKLIELAYASGNETDALADGGGISLLGDTAHNIAWSRTNNYWSSTEGHNVDANRAYHVNGNSVLSEDTLGTTVRFSSLEQVGTLKELRVDGIKMEGNVIETLDSNADIELRPAGTGTINLNNAKITNMADPVATTDGANLNSVNEAIRSRTLFFTINVTGETASTFLPTALNTLAPAGNFEENTTARILAEEVTLAGAQTNISVVTSSTGTNEIEVDYETYALPGGLTSTGVKNLSMPNGITLSGSSLGVTRTYHLLTISGGTWTYTNVITP